MADWDRAARDRLLEIVAQLREAKVVDFLERTVAHVWRANTDRYEPTEVGDTTRSLGITAAENIRELTLRGRWTPSGGECEIDEDVHVTAPDSSLLIECRGTNLRTCKARSMATLATPEWQGFNWATDSEVRLAAARNNLALYNPFGIGGGTLFDDVFPAQGDAKLMCEVFLVWAGGWSSPFTAGWLGLPTVYPEGPWLAVEPLWWHDGQGLSELGTSTKNTHPDADTFERRAAPDPKVTLKRKRREAEQ